MRYLLDVNSLVALGLSHHEFHARVASWVRIIAAEKSELATCAITELGFVRVLAQAPQYGLTVAQARELLSLLKSSAAMKFVFLPDDHDVSHLPSWVKTPRQTTDGHLEQLAKSKNAILATLDRKIPRAFLIPE